MGHCLKKSIFMLTCVFLWATRFSLVTLFVLMICSGCQHADRRHVTNRGSRPFIAIHMQLRETSVASSARNDQLHVLEISRSLQVTKQCPGSCWLFCVVAVDEGWRGRGVIGVPRIAAWAPHRGRPAGSGGKGRGNQSGAPCMHP